MQVGTFSVELAASQYARAKLTGGCVNSCSRNLLVTYPFVPVVRETRRSSLNSSTTATIFLHGKLNVDDFEAKWRGVRVAGQELFADAAEIFRMADADVLKLENLYASTGGARMIGRTAKTVLRHSRQRVRPPRKVCPFCFEADHIGGRNHVPHVTVDECQLHHASVDGRAFGRRG